MHVEEGRKFENNRKNETEKCPWRKAEGERTSVGEVVSKASDFETAETVSETKTDSPPYASANRNVGDSLYK